MVAKSTTLMTYSYMSHQANTPYKVNPEASDYHRVLGKKAYGSDIDMFEYTYNQDGTIKPIALFDYKYPGKQLGDNYSPIQLRITIADKLNLPFFVAVTYLDDKYPVKMYYIIPINNNAKNYFKRCELSSDGHWFSLRAFSKLQHALRGHKWNPEEEINDKNGEACGLPVFAKLKDLSNEVKQYPLPLLDF